MRNNIRIAIQKRGRLRDGALDFISSLGLKFKRQKNELVVTCNNANIELLYVRNSDIPEYVKNGVADFGIVGENVLYERNDKINTIKKLGFGKCELVIAIPEQNSNIKSANDLRDERIATSYINSLKKYLKTKNIKSSLILIRGSVEITPTLGLADAICDITQTGGTLKENKLKVLDTIIKSEAVLIESPFKNKNKKILLNLI